ncbi:hypothetical protein CH306_27490 [Rhodococcus sp. 15-725-2-2b]|nr:hypothetical protein CH277_28265 [Rhodococcus sp. 06-469-3-2]OZD40864.1 hypothetical protein CH264_24655 [Rhodococcus sp. 06-1477-1A]OZE01649.1 hypothetical protein CH250_26650 [Rhodococcus sp. 05-2255-3C]OZE12105.1 hypothetical protein CH249_09370 [Rhodococcus sp. 05-2255-3B1]OZE17173.1 hypothetical protein CH255_19020 [Rhodococcus sp. 05-2255-2A2]OZE66465.1 hypothetical protein CH306_27490 [Rhodococcus sp. 15-725-2-2b]
MSLSSVSANKSSWKSSESLAMVGALLESGETGVCDPHLLWWEAVATVVVGRRRTLRPHRPWWV